MTAPRTNADRIAWALGFLGTPTPHLAVRLQTPGPDIRYIKSVVKSLAVNLVRENQQT